MKTKYCNKNSEQPTKYKIIFLLLHVSTSVLMRTKSRKCQTHDKEAVNIFGLCVSLEWELLVCLVLTLLKEVTPLLQKKKQSLKSVHQTTMMRKAISFCTNGRKKKSLYVYLYTWNQFITFATNQRYNLTLKKNNK